MLRIVASPRFTLLARSLATHASTTAPVPVAASPTRYDWTKEEVQRIYESPLLDLVFRAASVHRQHHDPSKIQLCTLMNIKSEWFCSAQKREKSRPVRKTILTSGQVEVVAKTVRRTPPFEVGGRAHDIQVHTARSRLDTRPRRRLPVCLKLNQC